jgi:hypothetical protein
LLAIPISRDACVDHHRPPQPSNQRYRRLRWSKAANFTQWFEVAGATACLIYHRQVGPFDGGSISPHFFISVAKLSSSWPTLAPQQTWSHPIDTATWFGVGGIGRIRRCVYCVEYGVLRLVLKIAFSQLGRQMKLSFPLILVTDLLRYASLVAREDRGNHFDHFRSTRCWGNSYKSCLQPLQLLPRPKPHAVHITSFKQSTLAEISESPISVFVASEMIQSISKDCTYWFIQNFYSSSEVSGKRIGECNRYRCIYHSIVSFKQASCCSYATSVHEWLLCRHHQTLQQLIWIIQFAVDLGILWHRSDSW